MKPSVDVFMGVVLLLKSSVYEISIFLTDLKYISFHLFDTCRKIPLDCFLQCVVCFVLHGNLIRC